MEKETKRLTVTSGTPWERKVGYSRAVRAGGFVYVSGTTATDGSGGIVGAGDPYAQAVQTLNNIRVALEAAGSGIRDVVRTRIFVTDINNWERVGEAHREVFGEVRPAATMVEVRRFVSPEILVEIEAEAIIQDV